MSRLQELLDQYCPDGVEQKRIADIASYEQPRKYLVSSTDYSDEFDTPVLTAGQTFVLGYTDEKTGIYPASKDDPVIIFDDFTGAFKWVDFPFKAKSSAMKMIKARGNIVLLRYLYHMMGFLNYTSDEHKRLWISVYSEFEVPVPPIEVQREIVRILDSFTELTTELTTELAARRKQYEYYRDTLLDFDNADPNSWLGKLIAKYCPDGVEYRPVAEIATDIYRGAGIKREDVTEDGVPCVRYGEIYTTYGIWFDECVSHTTLDKVQSPKYFEHGDILFVITGESVEDIAKSTAYVGHDRCLAGGDIVVLKHNQDPKYLSYALSTADARRQKSAGKIKSKVVHSSVPAISGIVIPVPPLELQREIVKVLDRSSSLCSDVSEGLPAEIDARQKQYEYYRDRLLSF